MNKTDNISNILEGIYTVDIFTYFSLTVSSKKDTEENYNTINESLFKYDCRLQFYYTDVTASLSNYEKPKTSFVNSLFLQINPLLYSKKNIFK